MGILDFANSPAPTQTPPPDDPNKQQPRPQATPPLAAPSQAQSGILRFAQHASAGGSTPPTHAVAPSPKPGAKPYMGGGAEGFDPIQRAWHALLMAGTDAPRGADAIMGFPQRAATGIVTGHGLDPALHPFDQSRQDALEKDTEALPGVHQVGQLGGFIGHGIGALSDSIVNMISPKSPTTQAGRLRDMADPRHMLEARSIPATDKHNAHFMERVGTVLATQLVTDPNSAVPVLRALRGTSAVSGALEAASRAAEQAGVRIGTKLPGLANAARSVQRWHGSAMQGVTHVLGRRPELNKHLNDTGKAARISIEESNISKAEQQALRDRSLLERNRAALHDVQKDDKGRWVLPPELRLRYFGEAYVHGTEAMRNEVLQHASEILPRDPEGGAIHLPQTSNAFNDIKVPAKMQSSRTLYRGVDPRDAFNAAHQGEMVNLPFGAQHQSFVSPFEDMALGQSGQGAMIELAGEHVNDLRPSTSKPGAEFVRQQRGDHPEYTTSGYKPEAVKAITVPKAYVEGDAAWGSAHALQQHKGWKRVDLPDGRVRLENPDYAEGVRHEATQPTMTHEAFQKKLLDSGLFDHEDVLREEAPGHLDYDVQHDYQTRIHPTDRPLTESDTFRTLGGQHKNAFTPFENERLKEAALGPDQFDLTANRLMLGRNAVRFRRTDQETEDFLKTHGGWKGSGRPDVEALSHGPVRYTPPGWLGGDVLPRQMRQLGKAGITLNPLPHGIKNVGELAYLAGGPEAFGGGLAYAAKGLSKAQKARLVNAGISVDYLHHAEGPIAKVFEAASKPQQAFMTRLELGYRMKRLGQLDRELGESVDAEGNVTNLPLEYKKADIVRRDLGDYRNASRFVAALQAIGGPFATFRLGIVPGAVGRAALKNPQRLTNIYRTQTDINNELNNEGGDSTYNFGDPAQDFSRLLFKLRDQLVSTSSIGPLGELGRLGEEEQGPHQTAKNLAAEYTPGLRTALPWASLIPNAPDWLRNFPYPQSDERTPLEEALASVFGSYYGNPVSERRLRDIDKESER